MGSDESIAPNVNSLFHALWEKELGCDSDEYLTGSPTDSCRQKNNTKTHTEHDSVPINIKNDGDGDISEDREHKALEKIGTS